jgi:hypothetical protein
MQLGGEIDVAYIKAGEEMASDTVNPHISSLTLGWGLRTGVGEGLRTWVGEGPSPWVGEGLRQTSPSNLYL